MFDDEDVEDLLEEPALKLAERIEEYQLTRTQFKLQNHLKKLAMEV